MHLAMYLLVPKFQLEISGPAASAQDSDKTVFFEEYL
jgi:hypothetical protein